MLSSKTKSKSLFNIYFSGDLSNRYVYFQTNQNSPAFSTEQVALFLPFPSTVSNQKHFPKHSPSPLISSHFQTPHSIKQTNQYKPSSLQSLEETGGSISYLWIAVPWTPPPLLSLLVPLSPSLILLQLLRPPVPQTQWTAFLPQGPCTFSSLWLKCLSPQYSKGSFPKLLHFDT